MELYIGSMAVFASFGAFIGWALAQLRSPCATPTVEAAPIPAAPSADTMELVEARSELYRAKAELEQAKSELRQLQDLYEANATTDPLTELGNNRALRDRLEQEFQRSIRYGAGLSVMRVDIDDLSAYNTAFGDRAGNKLIKKVAAILKGSARNTDMIAAHGGGEFVVVLTETDVRGATLVAHRVLAHVAELSNDKWNVTVTIGISSLRRDTETASKLMDEAQAALSSGKASGKNRIVPHDQLQKADARPACGSGRTADVLDSGSLGVPGKRSD